MVDKEKNVKTKIYPSGVNFRRCFSLLFLAELRRLFDGNSNEYRVRIDSVLELPLSGATVTVYQAIFQGPEFTVSVTYEPGPDGLIFITDVTVTERAVTAFEDREADRLEQPKRQPRQMEMELP